MHSVSNEALSWEEKRAISFSYLDRYKQQIPEEIYTKIKQTIGSQAIEGVFSTEESISRMINMASNKSLQERILNSVIKKHSRR